MKTRYQDIDTYVTKDGSTIRELMHPGVHGKTHGSVKQSLAEAEVPVGVRTLPHCHNTSEELYHVIQGEGRMSLGSETFSVGPGDTVCIPPGTVHSIENIGTLPLRVLCCCSPPYDHHDTKLIQE
jgi:mannose-6-phosphate isomerase-like protein (cupin superfamily)